MSANAERARLIASKIVPVLVKEHTADVAIALALITAHFASSVSPDIKIAREFLTLIRKLEDDLLRQADEEGASIDALPLR